MVHLGVVPIRDCNFIHRPIEFAPDSHGMSGCTVVPRRVEGRRRRGEGGGEENNEKRSTGRSYSMCTYNVGSLGATSICKTLRLGFIKN